MTRDLLASDPPLAEVDLHLPTGLRLIAHRRQVLWDALKPALLEIALHGQDARRQG